MTSLPDWLVERAALDEVPPASRGRIDTADPRELADRIAALRADNAAELAAHPAGPAVAQIEARIAGERHRLATRRRQRRLRWLGLVTASAGLAVVVLMMNRTTTGARVGSPPAVDDEGTRVKGSPRLVAFRQAGDHAERLEQDSVVRAGDLIQLRYSAGGQGYGVIASVDGAGTVTLHHPVSEDAPAAATALAPRLTTLPSAYALDDAPRFERFFFITANAPIEIKPILAALRTLAARADSDTALPELPAELHLHLWSLRLRKPSSTP